VPRPAITIATPATSSRTARTVLVALTLLLTGAVSACSTGFGAQTTTMYTAPAGADVRTGDIKGLNMLVVADEGSGTLVAALVNPTEDDDELVGVTATDLDSDAEISVTGLDTPVELPAGELVQVAAEDDEVTPIGLSGDSVQPGQVLQLSLQFSRAGAISAEIPVVTREGAYTSVPTPPTPETPDAG
jgi:copper(I)-binding protein